MRERKAPDLYEIWRDAHRWNEEMDIKSFREGVKAGKEEAGQMIIDTIDEPVISRVERVCRVNLGAMLVGMLSFNKARKWQTFLTCYTATASP